MFDVRVFHPNVPSHKGKTMSQLYKQKEKSKKREYGERVVQIEKASFTPLVYSTHGGMAEEAAAFHKRLARLIADKKKERYSDVMGHMRTKLRFSMLRSTLIALRGVRSKQQHRYEPSLSFLDFGLIPESLSYEEPA